MITLETGGNPIDLQAHNRFLRFMTQHFDVAHRAVFALPVLTEDGRVLTWNTEQQGTITHFDALPPPARQDLLQHIARIYADITRAATATDGFPHHDWEQMQRFPDTSALWLVGTQPVITRWGLPGVSPHDLLPAVSSLSEPAASLFPILRHAPSLMVTALAGAGLGLIAAAVLFWRLTALFHSPCLVPSLPTPPTPHLPPPSHALPEHPTVPPLPPHAETTAADDVKLAHEAGGRSGKLEIVLIWQDKNDLDLHVTLPSEAKIYFNHRTADGGALDLDANQAVPGVAQAADSALTRALEKAENFFGQKIASSGPGNTPTLTDHPVEHVTWENAPPAGHYTVQVDPYAMPYASTSPYRVSVFYNGKELASRTGTATRGHTIEVNPTETTITEFDIPG